MQRRKLLTGLGMLAAGGAATVGTGAFTSAEASRSVTVTVEGDADAYLSLDASTSSENSGFTTQSADGIGIDINDVTGVTDPADGVGLNSVYEFDKLFQVENQGTQEIEFEIETLSGDDFGSNVGEDELTVEFYTGSDADDPLDGDPVTLGTGDSKNIGVKVDTEDPSTSDFSAEATVSADKSST